MSVPSILSTTPFYGKQPVNVPIAVAHTVPPGTTLLVVAFFDRSGSGVTALDLSVGASSLINVDGVTGEAPQFWYLLNPPIGAITVNIKDTWVQTVAQGAIYNVQGNHMTLPFGPVVATVGAGTRTLTSIVISTPNDLAIDCAGISEAAIYPPYAMTPGANQTERFDFYNVIDPYHRAAGSSKLSVGSATPMTYSMLDIPSNVMFLHAAVAIHGTPIPIAMPPGLFAVRRANYTVLKWTPLTQDWAGQPISATSYIVRRASQMDESDAVDLATITTTDAIGQIDTAYVDVNAPDTAVYRVIAVSGALQSEPSDRAVAMKSTSLIDGKGELLDRELLFWDDGNWDEKLWA
jgi:hypothetical protein